MFKKTATIARVCLLAGVISAAGLAFACSPSEPGASSSSPTPDGAMSSPQGSSSTPTPGPAQSPTASPQDQMAREIRDELCIPPTPLGVSPGDSWTIMGPVNVTGNFPGTLPEGAAEVGFTFIVRGIEDNDFGTSEEPLVVENSMVEVETVSVINDAQGKALVSDMDMSTSNAIRVLNLAPVLTPDWECHTQKWMDSWAEVGPSGGSAPPEATVEERSLASGAVAQLFTVEQTITLSPQSAEQTVRRSFGYDKQTGRLVLVETYSQGTYNGEAFELNMTQEFSPDHPTLTVEPTPTPEASGTPGAETTPTPPIAP